MNKKPRSKKQIKTLEKANKALANKTDIKHSLFIKAYLKSLNGVKAYMEVYPDATYDTARNNASDLLARDYIQAEIQKRLKSIHMSVDEVLKLLADHARANLDDFLDETGEIDLDKARKAGVIHLLKDFEIVESTTKNDETTTRYKIRLHDPQKALELIGKYYALFTDKVQQTEKKVIHVTIKREEE